MNLHWTEDSTKAYRYRITADFLTQLEKKMEVEPVKHKELAARMGVSPGRISQILNGETNNFELDSIIRFARSLGMKVSVVAYDDHDPDNTRGPVDPEIFTTCWERQGRPMDFFELRGESGAIEQASLYYTESSTSGALFVKDNVSNFVPRNPFRIRQTEPTLKNVA